MSLIEKLDSVLARLGETSEGNYLSRLANGTSIALEAVNLLRDHGPAIRQTMIDAERYQFIRTKFDPSIADDELFYLTGEAFDAAIDAARATGEGEGNG